MDEREALVRRYLEAVETFDAQAMRACCTPGMTQTEFPNMLTPMTRTRGLDEMAAGVSVSRDILVAQRYNTRFVHVADGGIFVEMTWRGRLKQAPDAPEMRA